MNGEAGFYSEQADVHQEQMCFMGDQESVL